MVNCMQTNKGSIGCRSGSGSGWNLQASPIPTKPVGNTGQPAAPVHPPPGGIRARATAPAWRLTRGRYLGFSNHVWSDDTFPRILVGRPRFKPPSGPVQHSRRFRAAPTCRSPTRQRRLRRGRGVRKLSGEVAPLASGPRIRSRFVLLARVNSGFSRSLDVGGVF